MSLLTGILTRMFPPAPQPVSELGIGTIATVRGVVVPRELMSSPLLQARCVYYRYTVQQWRRSRVGGDGFWEVIERDEAIMEFYLDDGGGRVIVSPERAHVRVGIGPGREPRAALHTVLLAADRKAQELVILPGERVEVTAQVAEVDDLYDEARDYRADPRRLMLCAPGSGHLQIRVLSSGSITGSATTGGDTGDG